MLRFLRYLLSRLKHQPAFVIQLQAGQASLQQGQVPKAFLKGCEDIASLYEVRQGLILGLSRSTGIQLVFEEIPESCQQNFRNLWVNFK